MWPGQQPPGGEQNPQDSNPYQQPGYQQPNPYQQPGYQQQNPYAQAQGPGAGQQQPWAVPTVQMGGPQPGGDRRKTMITAIVAAIAVVVAAGVTGFLVLGKDDKKDDEAGPAKSSSAAPSPSGSSSAGATGGAGDDDNPRGGSGPKPTIPGWKVVVNPKWGTAFDVPPDWVVDDPGMITGFEDATKDDGSPAIVMSAPAWDKKKWCTSDDDHDGQTDDTALAAAGTKGQNGAKNTDEPAVNDSAWWVFAGYTDMKDSDKKLLTIGKAKPYTTKSGIKGSVASSYTTGVKKTDKCDSDGKATTFAFKNSVGDFVTWTLYGAKGVSDEVPDATIQKIMSTVRLHGTPSGSS